MKKRLTALLAAVLLLAGCAGGAGDRSGDVPGNESSSRQEEKQPDSVPEDSTIPGTWSVPNGWVKADKYSSVDKVFYVEEGHENDEQPDNISIEVGTNRYSADDHEQFREAILRQLLMQTQGVEAELTGDGTFTEQDYILYIFTITQEDVTTKQYYIVGDQRYCLVHLTSFTGSERADEAAQAIADSFVWDSAED